MYFLTNNLPSFLALNLSVTVLNIPPSPSQLSSSAIGVPVIVVPSKLRPFGSPSIVLNISASLSKHVTVAAFIGTPSVHFGLPGSSRTVSITLLFTSTSGKFSSGFGFSEGLLPPPFSTSSLSASVPESWKSIYITGGAFGFSSFTKVYFTLLFTGVLSVVYSYLCPFIETNLILTVSYSNDVGASTTCWSSILRSSTESIPILLILYHFEPSALYSSPTM